jgi:hypothetical protein
MFLGLATGGMPVSIGWFWDIGVTSLSLWPLITVGNLGAWCNTLIFRKNLKLAN